MTTMQRFKAYFGMVPPGDYDDDYLDDGRERDDYYARSSRRDEFSERGGYAADEYDVRGVTEYDVHDRRYAEPDYLGREYVSRDEAGDFDRVPDYAYAGPARAADRTAAPMERLGRPARLEPLAARSAGPVRAGGRVTRGALALDPRESIDRVFEEGSPLAKITTLRPRDYSEARTIGERFRDGSPVIMDLVEMSNEDAKRLVDFAAGLAFALRGAFDKVATKVFLLSPADVDVSPEDRRRIVETGFYNQS
ncbi:cell division protein SepF [Williamsia sp. CHRR-6]|uniref:cell division protein SepF n=1 Tax=Williamsia sp. CHRR-6 TaxID=2835871 RepID=UPI001BDB290B|nr:cell division protein SepF [Williamsia sp. CHRR-6]MBT0565255.1 cell division protein SepF [Williamsia sp. CHRR-6]